MNLWLFLKLSVASFIFFYHLSSSEMMQKGCTFLCEQGNTLSTFQGVFRDYPIPYANCSKELPIPCAKAPENIGNPLTNVHYFQKLSMKYHLRNLGS